MFVSSLFAMKCGIMSNSATVVWHGISVTPCPFDRTSEGANVLTELSDVGSCHSMLGETCRQLHTTVIKVTDFRSESSHTTHR